MDLMLLDVVRQAIRRHSMIERGDCVMVAVSGGADSMALLRVLCELRDELDCRLVVAHLDHGFRPSSADDARFVEEEAARLGLPLVLERCDLRAEAEARRQGIEEAGRDLRRAFLARVAADQGASRIALGHTADDQAETVLFRLARGAGWSGLGGMAPASGLVIRPLLCVTRAEVREYASSCGLVWREDETNADLAYTRNRIRSRVLPELATINPDVARSIARSAEIAREMREVQEFIVDRLWGEVAADESTDVVRLERARLAALPAAVQSVLLREAMRRARGDLRELGRCHVTAAQRLAAGPSERGELVLPRLRVLVSRAAVDFLGARRLSGPWLVPVSVGRTDVVEAGLSLEVALVSRAEAPEMASGDRWEEVADADAVAFPLVARSRRRGDRFVPLGMPTDVRLKSFLINARVPADSRDRVALVCDQEKIVWVAGVRLSDRVRLKPSTERVLVMRAKQVRE